MQQFRELAEQERVVELLRFGRVLQAGIKLTQRAFIFRARRDGDARRPGRRSLRSTRQHLQRLIVLARIAQQRGIAKTQARVLRVRGQPLAIQGQSAIAITRLDAQARRPCDGIGAVEALRGRIRELARERMPAKMLAQLAQRDPHACIGGQLARRRKILQHASCQRAVARDQQRRRKGFPVFDLAGCQHAAELPLRVRAIAARHRELPPRHRQIVRARAQRLAAIQHPLCRVGVVRHQRQLQRALGDRRIVRNLRGLGVIGGGLRGIPTLQREFGRDQQRRRLAVRAVRRKIERGQRLRDGGM
jgi:hypothetical protein